MGKRAQYEGFAIRKYADGWSIEEIEAETGVSSTSLYKWKSQSKRPDQEMDEWERARARKADNLHRLTVLFERQLEFVEDTIPSKVTAPMIDALSKLGALVGKWKETEEAVKKALKAIDTAESEGGQDLTADKLREIIKGSYGV